MSILVAGATGLLGGLTIHALLKRGVDTSDLIAAGRNPQRLAELAGLGIRTARIDFDDPESMRAAFSHADKLLLISAPGGPSRVVQHTNAIRSAEAAGVKLLCYTSWLHADTSSMAVAGDHRMTEQALAQSDVDYSILRCAGYFEARTAMIPFWRARGHVLGAAADGQVSSITRSDVAEAAVTVLTTTGHESTVYELASDKPYTMAAFAAELSRQSGVALPFVNVDPDEFTRRLAESGIHPRLATNLADYDRATASGECVCDTGDLRHLIGHPPTELAGAVAHALTLD